jgi:DNA-binding winged helix-turn-helix (wHTH) protein/tetratricopeptide (TPR) repeat protein
MLHTFLDFELDEELCELRCQGQAVATQGRVLDLIALLLRSRDRVVSRDELMDTLWQGNVVSDAAISQVIMLARKALGDEGESQRVIKTVRGRGIRFVAPVQSAERAIAEASALPEARETELPTSALASPHVLEPLRDEPLLGRSSELRALLARLGRAELGRGSLVLVEGEPGVGKTTLAEQLASAAEERGFEVIWGRAWEGGGAPPFWPWIQVLRAIAQREGSEQLHEWLGSGGAELLPLLPELASASAYAERGAAGAAWRSEALSQDLDGARARFRQFDVLSRMLRHLCSRAADGSAQRRRPWLILLDDLHAADEASVQLVRFLMPDLGDLGLLLVGTYRGLECGGREALTALVDGNSHDNTIHLRGLSPSDVAELLTRKLGKPVSSRVSQALHDLSAGNPLLLAELCGRISHEQPEALLELEHLADFALPERIAGAVRKHLTELPSETRGALSAASALGREFSQPLLAEVLACSEPQLLEQLLPALRRGVLRPAGAAGRLTFSHVLVCNAVYAELLPQRRLELHRRIGELLERSEAPGRLPLHELAHHFYLAASDGPRAKALDYAQRAAEQACSVMAHELGAALYDRALALAELEHADDAHMHTLLCAAGTAWYRSGDIERSSVRYDRAAQLSRSAGDFERYAEAVVMCGCALRSVMLHETARQQRNREALALLPAGDTPLRARLLAISGLGLCTADTLAERQATTLAAVDMARRLGDSEVLLWTLNARHFVLWGAAPPEELLSIAREIVELARRTDNCEVLLDGLLWCGYDYAELGDAIAMRRVRDEYLAVVERYMSPWHRYMALGSDTLEAWVYGDLKRARELSARMWALGQQVQDRLAETFQALRLMLFDLQQDTAGPCAPSPFAMIEAPACVAAPYRPFWALSWAARGYLEAARNMLKQTLAHEHELLDSMRGSVLALMAEVSVLLNEREAAQRVYQLLLPLAGRHLLLQACVYLGPVDHYLGLVASYLGRSDAASAHFERALVGVMSPSMAAHTQYEQGRCLARTATGRESGRALLVLADEHAERFGLVRLRGQVGRALAEL